MQLYSVEHKLNTSSTFFSSTSDSPVIKTLHWKGLDSPLIKTLERENLILMKKNVEEVFNLCSTEQSCIHIGITCYKISTLKRPFILMKIMIQGQN